MNYGVYDIESTNWINFEILGFTDGNIYKTFRTPEAFLNYIDKASYMGWRFYAHNGGKFDVLFLIEALLERGHVRKIIERAGRLIAVQVKTANTSYVLADSYALLPQSLKALSDAFRPEHRKLSMDYTRINAKSERTLRYLENDVYCTYEILEAFFNSDYVVKPQYTIASQALNTFTKQFCPSHFESATLPDEEQFRDRYYHGGRVEVFKGSGKVNYYDVNSLFPFAMLNEMPTGVPKRTRTYRKGLIGFYKVCIGATPEWYISPLLTKAANKNFYVNGPGTYYLSSAMIEFLRSVFALKVNVESGVYFPGRETLFNDYVRMFYALKQNHKGGALEVIAKLFLNALYGKFGQSRWRQSYQQWTGQESGFYPGDDFYGMILVKEESRSRFIMPYLSAYITDLARLHHFKLMNRKPDAMYYCDTDSLLTSADYSKQCGKEIGELKMEGTYDGIFLNAKQYALKNGKEERVVFKGFATDSFSFSDFKKASKGKVLRQVKERILSYRECIHRRAEVERERGAFLKVALQEKVSESQYDRRLIYAEKSCLFDSAPFHYADIHKQQTRKEG